MAKNRTKDKQVWAVMISMGYSLQEVAETYGIAKQTVFEGIQGLPGYRLAKARKARKSKVRKAPDFSIESAGKVLDRAIQDYGKTNKLGYSQAYHAFGRTKKGKGMIEGYSSVIRETRKREARPQSNRTGKKAHQEASSKLNDAVIVYQRENKISNYNTAYKDFVKTPEGKNLDENYQASKDNR